MIIHTVETSKFFTLSSKQSQHIENANATQHISELRSMMGASWQDAIAGETDPLAATFALLRPSTSFFHFLPQQRRCLANVKCVLRGSFSPPDHNPRKEVRVVAYHFAMLC